MTRLDLTLPTAAENLALDEALLLAAEDGTGGEVLRLWEQPGYAVVLGAGGSVTIDVNDTACAADGVPVVRRASGGGTVVIGPGCLCVSVVVRIVPGLDSIGGATGFVMGKLRDAAAPFAPGVEVAGTGDLAVAGRKVSGSAQQRKRRHVLHHATLLCGFDLGRVGRYLRPPERAPEYRAGRDHAVFVTNLSVGVAELRERVAAAWEVLGEYEPVPLGRVRELVDEKYGRDEWNRRR
ncbi:MAG TPA: biotin/lipoate A/B protein ligase family protein [Urbifossiella sp.]|nr:biotin/lipoate A/B protein ligase family protein [Urbifossiella sp.]